MQWYFAIVTAQPHKGHPLLLLPHFTGRLRISLLRMLHITATSSRNEPSGWRVRHEFGICEHFLNGQYFLDIHTSALSDVPSLHAPSAFCNYSVFQDPLEDIHSKERNPWAILKFPGDDSIFNLHLWRIFRLVNHYAICLFIRLLVAAPAREEDASLIMKQTEFPAMNMVHDAWQNRYVLSVRFRNLHRSRLLSFSLDDSLCHSCPFYPFLEYITSELWFSRALLSQCDHFFTLFP